MCQCHYNSDTHVCSSGSGVDGSEGTAKEDGAEEADKVVDAF